MKKIFLLIISIVTGLTACNRQPVATAFVGIYGVNEKEIRYIQSVPASNEFVKFNIKKNNLNINFAYKNDLSDFLRFNYYAGSSFFEIEVFTISQSDAIILLNNALEYLDNKYKMKIIEHPAIHIKNSIRTIQVDKF